MTGVGSGRRDPWRPVPAGRGVGKRFARPADFPDRGQVIAGKALPGLTTADFGASPEGVMTMSGTLTTAGPSAGNALPFKAAGPSFPTPAPARLPATALSLLRNARQGLAEAETETDAGTRYIGAHLAALRAAAAIVAARGEPGTGSPRRRPRSVWELLPQVEPALAEWAAFFAASAAKRAAAEAGLPRAATAREADDLLRDAGTFLTVAERALGLEGEPMLPLSLRHAS
jgi:hypothetical protein